MGYIDRLAQDFRVVSMDLRGHGDSEKPADAGSYAPRKVVADVLAVLDAVGTSAVAYWGYSLGSKVAQMMMAQAPEWLTAVVMGGSAPGSVNIVGVQAMLDALRQGIGRYVEMTDARGILTPEARAFFLQNDAAALAAFLAAHAEWDEVEPLAERPMLVYAGTADPVFESAREYAERRPSAQFLEVPNRNHGEAFTQHERTLPAVLRFLEQAKGDEERGTEQPRFH